MNIELKITLTKEKHLAAVYIMTSMPSACFFFV